MRQMLVVSDPPHGAVDHQAVADVLGLGLEHASSKIAFAAPEVLRAGEEERAIPFATLLTDAGLRVAVIDGAELTRVPWPTPVESIAFRPDGLVGRSLGRDLLVRYDEQVIALYCKPPAGYVRPKQAAAPATPNGLGAAEAIDGMTILDLYVERHGVLGRMSIVAGVTDVGAVGGAAPADGMAGVLAECRRRFPRVRVDARLENVRPRQRFVAGEQGFDVDMRKHYSFGTLLLRHALASISSDLKDLPHYEFGSRLGCVLARH